MKKENNDKIRELKKEIVIERLRQSPSTIKVSFGSIYDGKFMNRDELIKNVKEGTEIGERIIDIHLAFLKSFKRELLIDQ